MMYELSIVKSDVWVCIFLFFYVCFVNVKKKELNVLTCIPSNILGINKFMLYFPWKYKNMFLYIFWDLITGLLKP